jgi:hypothetical protein
MPSLKELDELQARQKKNSEKFYQIINDKSISDEQKFKKSIQNALKSSYSYQNNDNTNINIFTNNKNSNNVVYIGSYSVNSNLSRSSCNNSNGISYGPTLF